MAVPHNLLNRYPGRRLSSKSAWQAFQRALRVVGGVEFFTVARTDPILHGLINELNTTLLQLAIGMGGNDAPNLGGAWGFGQISGGEYETFIPWLVWGGVWRYPYIQNDTFTRAAYRQLKKDYRYKCGQIRVRLATLWALVSLTNDLANSQQTPNPGGTGKGHITAPAIPTGP